MSIVDINKDGIVQLAEITIGGDLIVLATPEIAGLPYVITGLVAAGGLAAALSTADGLLLTIANALSHDVYLKIIDPNAPTTRRIVVSKALLLVVAACAAYVTSLKPGDILFLVGAAFSLAASGFFPALVLGVFWKRANKLGAILGMLAGLGTACTTCTRPYPFFFGVNAPLWWDINRSRQASSASGRLHRPDRRFADFPGTVEGSSGAGRSRPLPEPRRRHDGYRRSRSVVLEVINPLAGLSECASQLSKARSGGPFFASIFPQMKTPCGAGALRRTGKV